MAFRAEEAAQDGFDRAYQYLIPQGADSRTRVKVKNKLLEIVEECGPVIDGYPAWHPFLAESDSTDWSPGVPDNCPSFSGLEHTIYFVNGILTCPYGHAAESLIEQINKLSHRDAWFGIRKLEGVALYNESAVPLLITCNWMNDWKEFDNTFSIQTALGLMLEREVPNWRHAKYCESWEDMRGQILGHPHGARSSLFVNQIAGQQLKNFWNQMIKSGLLGDPRN